MARNSKASGPEFPKFLCCREIDPEINNFGRVFVQLFVSMEKVVKFLAHCVHNIIQH